MSSSAATIARPRKNRGRVEPADYEYYLANLAEFKAHYDVAVYAWCLMTNHVHLILCPRTRGSAISALMQSLQTCRVDGAAGVVERYLVSDTKN